MTRSPSMTHPSDTEPRRHPLAVAALIISLLGIPLFGLVTGPVAVVLAGVALSQISLNPFFRGKALAMAAMVIGICDTVLWIALLGIVAPKLNRADTRSVRDAVLPSFRAPQRAPDTIRRALESNVFLSVTSERQGLFRGKESFTGSGVILGRKDGEFLIVTNRHVVDPSYKTASEHDAVVPHATIRAYFHDGSRADARVWWFDPQGADLAVLATGPHPERIPVQWKAPAREVLIGDKVFTVGNPHELSWTYGEGVVSGIREIPQGGSRVRVIQTQIPVNQGHSGGGLYQADGTLIGIVSWTKDKAIAEGIGFAIPYEDFLSRFARDSSRSVGERDGSPPGQKSP